MRRLVGCAVVVVAITAIVAGVGVAAGTASSVGCSGKTSVPHSKYKLKVDYVVLITCKSARKLAVAASPQLARLVIKGVRSNHVGIKGFPGFRCDNTGFGDQVGNFYFGCTRKISAKRYQAVNWTFGPEPV
jgi:hypothetical protein